MSHIPQEVQTVLQRFRRWIRRYIFLEGLAILVAVASLMFWVTYLLDIAYFRFSNLELPATLRLICLLAMVGILVGMGVSWVLLRLLRKFRLPDLALALERRFPQLRDQLITAVEMDDSTATPLQAEMLQRTRQEVAEKVARLPLEETFDRNPLKKLTVLASVLFGTLAVFGVTNGAEVERWVQAYVFTQENYWDPFRRQVLTLKVLAQPGEVVREFDANRTYKHPRGADLQLLVESDGTAVAPEDVTIQYLAYRGRSTERGRLNMNRFGEDRFRQTFSRVLDDHRLWIRGGDFVNRTPYRILVVDPPQVNEITLKCDYPSYTGMDGMEDQLVTVVGSQVALPMETIFDLQARCNKPIRRVDVRTSRFDLSFGFEDATAGKLPLPTRLVLRDDESRIVRELELNAAPGAILATDGTSFALPLRITARVEEDWEQLAGLAEFPLSIPRDTELKIFLEDADGIYSPEPTTLFIKGIVDQAPVVDIKRTGVGTLVTRNANLPLEGRITDDYGVEQAWFRFKRVSDEEPQEFPLAQPPRGQKEFRLDDGSGRRAERFSLRPLKLQEGESFTLTIQARDGDELNGPQTAQGENFSFKVVTEDELLARLFDREVNLRLRFEQIRTEVGELRQRLESQVTQFQASSEPLEAQQSDLSAFIERSLHQLRKNQTESKSIEVSFRDLREEMVNNGIDTRDKLDRIDNGVIAPLLVLNDELFLDADQRYAFQRLALQRKTGVGEAFQETGPAVDAVLRQMDRILEEMRDRGTINDVIQNLQKLIEAQKKLLKETEEKRIEENFFFDFNR